MLRALFIGAACMYYRWLLNCMHPTHPEHGAIALRHALLESQLRAWLRGEA